MTEVFFCQFFKFHLPFLPIFSSIIIALTCSANIHVGLMGKKDLKSIALISLISGTIGGVALILGLMLTPVVLLQALPYPIIVFGASWKTKSILKENTTDGRLFTAGFTTFIIMTALSDLFAAALISPGAAFTRTDLFYSFLIMLPYGAVGSYVIALIVNRYL